MLWRHRSVAASEKAAHRETQREGGGTVMDSFMGWRHG
jgi:hypothetical protein